MAGEILRQALGALDRLVLQGAGNLVVLPWDVPMISAGQYHDVTYVAWPLENYAMIEAEWQVLSPFNGPRSPFSLNADIADSVARKGFQDNIVVTLALLGAGVTVSTAAARIRALLQAAGLPTVQPAAQAPKKPARFPWGWVLGTAALGAGIIAILATTDQHGVAP